MHAYILLDRSGSMASLWTEALSSVNAYVKDLGDAHVTLALFDHHAGPHFDVIRAGVPAARWTPVSDRDATPRGGTPLYDAIGRILTLAERDDEEKAVLVIMTDGEENQSHEMSKDDVKASIARAEKRGWEVVFLGANFADFSDADAVGLASLKVMAMEPASMLLTMQHLARKSRAYFDADEEITFDAADRAAAGEEEVKKRKGS
jgi:uncharacterized protein with von Willebrand factor type A (vWA) domain